MDSKAVEGLFTYKEEFKLAVQLIPHQELCLVVWDFLGPNIEL
jgi:hypothetical protein